MKQWRGKWALVTGASAGIGAELARQLAAGGANLVLTARRQDRLSQLAKELAERHQVRTEICALDLAKAQAPGELFRFTQEKGLPIDVLINNAGFGAYGEFRKTEAQRLLDMVAVNVSAVVHLTHLFVPQMVERGSGYIMIVASTAAFQPVPYISTYAATKGFDLLLAEGLAEELRSYGVRVCGLCPGSTVSEFHSVAGQPSRMGGRHQATDEVARAGLEALAAGKSRVIAGTKNWISVEAQRLVPRGLVTRVAASMFRPEARDPDSVSHKR
jgi:short-subunit dehydrogenase